MFPLKGQLTDSLTHRHSLWGPSEGQQLGKCKRHRGVRVRAEGTVTIAPLSDPPPGQSTGGHHLVCTEPFPRTANSEAALAGEIYLLHALSPWGPAPPSPQIAPSELLATQPVPPCAFSGLHIYWQGAAFSSCSWHTAHTFQGRLLVAGHWSQPESQCLLGSSWGFAGLRRSVTGLAVI